MTVESLSACQLLIDPSKLPALGGASRSPSNAAIAQELHPQLVSETQLIKAPLIRLMIQAGVCSHRLWGGRQRQILHTGVQQRAAAAGMQRQHGLPWQVGWMCLHLHLNCMSDPVCCHCIHLRSSQAVTDSVSSPTHMLQSHDRLSLSGQGSFVSSPVFGCPSTFVIAHRI